jgi:hypothetical protein
MSRWPYFRSRESRQAIKKSQAVPVESCWNGLGMSSDPTSPFSRTDCSTVMMDAAPFYVTENRLAFRGIPDSLSLHRLEGSECCLIHKDNPVTPTKGVFLNPNVRVGYNATAYGLVNPANGAPWLSAFAIIRGSWENRLRRWLSTDMFAKNKVAKRIAAWQSEGPGRTEAGSSCLIDEMQVVSWNGWAHISPEGKSI